MRWGKSMKHNILVIVIILILVSCNYDSSPNTEGGLTNQVTEVDDHNYEEAYEETIYMVIYSELDRYQRTMSSVPGLPITIECYPSEDEWNHRLTVTCDSGELIRWQENGIVVVEGNRYHADYANTIIYWRPIESNIIGAQDTLKFYGYIGKEIETVRVHVDSDGYYLK